MPTGGGTPQPTWSGRKGPSTVLILVGMGFVFVLALAVILFFALSGDGGEAADSEASDAQEAEVIPDESAILHRPQAYESDWKMGRAAL